MMKITPAMLFGTADIIEPEAKNVVGREIAKAKARQVVEYLKPLILKQVRDKVEKSAEETSKRAFQLDQGGRKAQAHILDCKADAMAEIASMIDQQIQDLNPEGNDYDVH